MSEYRCPHCGKTDTIACMPYDAEWFALCDPENGGCGSGGPGMPTEKEALEAFCNPAWFAKRIEQLTTERDELRAQTDRLQQLSVHGLSADQGGWTVEAATEMAGMFAASMAALLEGHKAGSLIVMEVAPKNGGEHYTLTLRRKTGKTVEEKYLVVMAELNALRKKEEQIEAENVMYRLSLEGIHNGVISKELLIWALRDAITTDCDIPNLVSSMCKKMPYLFDVNKRREETP